MTASTGKYSRYCLSNVQLTINWKGSSCVYKTVQCSVINNTYRMSKIRHVYVKFYHIPNVKYTSMNVIMYNCSWKELFIHCQSISNQEVAGRKACRGQMGLRPSLPSASAVTVLYKHHHCTLYHAKLHCFIRFTSLPHIYNAFLIKQLLLLVLLLLSSCCPSNSSPSSLPLLISQPEAASSLTLCVSMWVPLYQSLALCNLSLSRVGPV